MIGYRKQKKKHLSATISFGMIIVSVVSLNCCSPIMHADSTFQISAQLENEEGKKVDNCLLELRNEKNNVLYEIKRIDGKFTEQLHVAPYEAEYLVVLSCPRYETRKIRVNFGKDVTTTKPLDLGIVKLELKSSLWRKL